MKTVRVHVRVRVPVVHCSSAGLGVTVGVCRTLALFGDLLVVIIAVSPLLYMNPNPKTTSAMGTISSAPFIFLIFLVFLARVSAASESPRCAGRSVAVSSCLRSGLKRFELQLV